MKNVEKNTRRYSHKLRDGYNGLDRVDFTETLLFSTQTQTKNGFLSGSFYISDLITKFEIKANSFTKNGRIGYKQSYFQTQKVVSTSF